MFSWGIFLNLNLISVKTLVNKFSPSLLRGDLTVFPEFSVVLYLSRNIYSCFIHTSVKEYSVFFLR